MSKQEKSIADSMIETANLSLDDFAYDLPPELIAQQPAAERSSSRLLVLHRNSGEIEHRVFSDLPDYLREGDAIVLNDTKVIPARIYAQRPTGSMVEILLLKPETTKPGVWHAMANPLRRLKLGDRLKIELGETETEEHFVTVVGFDTGADQQRRVLVDFGEKAKIHELLSKAGQMPLPPYILRERASDSSCQNSDDLERYQTVYANAPGAVAAPTAGLHFTPQLLAGLKDKGVNVCYLTLHVGAGTFKPITSSLEEHTIESEEFYIPEDTANTVNKCRSAGGRVFAVGTTSCRTLETAGASGTLRTAAAEESSLYIRPGHKFMMVDSLITNFHLSRSSLLVLVSAFAGHKSIMKVYEEAVAERYRFYSYGDSMLIL